jgi:hypothetical protein
MMAWPPAFASYRRAPLDGVGRRRLRQRDVRELPACGRPHGRAYRKHMLNRASGRRYQEARAQLLQGTIKVEEGARPAGRDPVGAVLVGLFLK